MSKRITIILLICAMLFNQFSVHVNAEENVSSYDERYEKACEILVNIGIIPETEKPYTSTVKRDEFAFIIASMYGISSSDASNSNEVDSNKYTGYTNEVEKDDWLWEADKPKENESIEIKEETGTPFYDVRRDDLYYSSIRFMSQIGYMVGNDGYFRPHERITGYEMIKVMINMLSASFRVTGGYPEGYETLAATLKLTDGLNNKDLSQFVTYRDFVVCLMNTLNQDSYVSEYDDGVKNKLNGLTLLENEFGICYEEGVLKTNSITTIDSSLTESINGIVVGDYKYKCDSRKYDDYLGYYVGVYYTEKHKDREVKYIVKEDINTDFLINADDVADYNHPYLEYYKDDKLKKEYLGSNISIIYNGILMDNFSQNEIVPSVGVIKFVDNDSDGKNDIVFINNSNIVWVNFVDADNYTVYDKLTNTPVELSEYERIITDINGNELSFSNIKTNSVLSIQKTTDKQHNDIVNIIISNKTISGILTEIYELDDEIKIDDNIYKKSALASNEIYELGKGYTFYLDNNNEVVGWTDLSDGLQWGYMISATKDEDSKNYIFARIYDFNKNGFANYEFAEKLTFNDSKKEKAENVIVSNAIFNSSEEKTKAQVVKFRLNAENKIVELITADATDELKTIYTGSTTLRYRQIPMAFIRTQPHFYVNTNTRYLSVPATDTENEDLYFESSLVQDKEYKPNLAYSDGGDSYVAQVIIKKEEDSVATSNVADNRAEVFIITRKSEIVKDGEYYTKLECQNHSGKKEFIVEQKKKFDVVNSYNCGDLIRASYYENTMQVTAIERMFDCEKMMFTQESYYWIDTYPNPMMDTNTGDQHFVSAFGLIHGYPAARYDEGEIIRLTPYLYQKDNDGIWQIDRSSSMGNDYYLKGRSFAVYKYDRKNKELTQTTFDAAVYDAKSAGVGTELVAYSKWGEPKIMFIYE